VWPAILTAGVVSLANLTLLALAAAVFVRHLLPVVRRLGVRAPFWGAAAVLGTALAALLQSPNYPVSHGQLFDLLRSGGEEYDAHRIDALIYRVRQKLRSLPESPMQIRNIYGEGFLMLRRSSSVDIVLES